MHLSNLTVAGLGFDYGAQYLLQGYRISGVTDRELKSELKRLISCALYKRCGLGMKYLWLYLDAHPILKLFPFHRISQFESI